MSVRTPVLLGPRMPGKPLGRPEDWPLSLCPLDPPSQNPFDFVFSRGLPAMAGGFYGTALAIDRGWDRRRGMIDNVNPTNQFHPYMPVRDTPVAERQTSSLDKVHDYAFFGGLAVAAFGLGLLIGRRRPAA